MRGRENASMDFSGEYRIPAPRDIVWAALNDPDVLRDCIDGCESFEKASDMEFQARIKAKVGPVSARFTTTVMLSEIDPPTSYVISGAGQGGAAGFAKGNARVTLTDDGDGTLLAYASEATVGGKLASVGGRLIKGIAEKTAEDFFKRFSDRVVNGPSKQPPETAEEAAEDTTEDAGGVDDGVIEEITSPVSTKRNLKKGKSNKDDEDDGPSVLEKLGTLELSVKDKVILGGVALMFVGMALGLAIALLQGPTSGG